MADPITIYDQNHKGHIITIFLAYTSAGATATTITILAGYPRIDLSKAHPIISAWQFATEGDTISNSTVFKPAGECIRDVAADPPDTAGEYQIMNSNQVKFLGTDKDGTIAICYWAAGNKQL